MSFSFTKRSQCSSAEQLIHPTRNSPCEQTTQITEIGRQVSVKHEPDQLSFLQAHTFAVGSHSRPWRGGQNSRGRHRGRGRVSGAPEGGYQVACQWVASGNALPRKMSNAIRASAETRDWTKSKGHTQEASMCCQVQEGHRVGVSVKRREHDIWGRVPRKIVGKENGGLTSGRALAS